MKKQLLICGALVCAIVSQAATDTTPRYTAKVQQRRWAAEHSATSSLKWLPKSIESYYWDGTQWVEASPQTCTYDERGNLLTEVNPYEKRVYEYDSNNQVVSYKRYEIIENVETLSMIETYKYDTVVKDYVIYREETSYDNEGNVTWVNKSEKEIVRDIDGNITSVSDKFYDAMDQSWRPETLLTISYKDGKASEITVTEYDKGEPMTGGLRLTDMVWHETNGQILPSDLNDFDEEDYLEGANRLTSAKLVNFDHFPAAVLFKAEFTDKDFKFETSYNGKLITKASREYTDAYGSYKENVTDVDWDEDENGNVYEDGTCTIEYSESYDAYGMLLSCIEKEAYDDGDSWYNEIRGTVTYDDAKGYPTEYITERRGSDTPEYEKSQRVIYSDYICVDGVEAVVAEDASAPVEYYNLQGVRVDNPAAGLYIRRQGTNVTKVLVK